MPLSVVCFASLIYFFMSKLEFSIDIQASGNATLLQTRVLTEILPVVKESILSCLTGEVVSFESTGARDVQINLRAGDDPEVDLGTITGKYKDLLGKLGININAVAASKDGSKAVDPSCLSIHEVEGLKARILRFEGADFRDSGFGNGIVDVCVKFRDGDLTRVVSGTDKSLLDVLKEDTDFKRQLIQTDAAKSFLVGLKYHRRLQAEKELSVVNLGIVASII